MASWYHIPSHTEKRHQCAAIGCIMYAAITDGGKALCVQHATLQAMQSDIVLRAMHSTADHHEDGRCVFCGGTDWRYEMGMHQCNHCWPKGAYKSGDKQMIDAMTLPMFQGTLSVPVGHSTPKGDDEQRRLKAVSDGYLSWRNGGRWQ